METRKARPRTGNQLVTLIRHYSQRYYKDVASAERAAIEEVESHNLGYEKVMDCITPYKITEELEVPARVLAYRYSTMYVETFVIVKAEI